MDLPLNATAEKLYERVNPILPSGWKYIGFIEEDSEHPFVIFDGAFLVDEDDPDLDDDGYNVMVQLSFWDDSKGFKKTNTALSTVFDSLTDSGVNPFEPDGWKQIHIKRKKAGIQHAGILRHGIIEIVYEVERV